MVSRLFFYNLIVNGVCLLKNNESLHTSSINYSAMFQLSIISIIYGIYSKEDVYYCRVTLRATDVINDIGQTAKYQRQLTLTLMHRCNTNKIINKHKISILIGKAQGHQSALFTFIGAAYHLDPKRGFRCYFLSKLFSSHTVFTRATGVHAQTHTYGSIKWHFNSSININIRNGRENKNHPTS